MLARLDPLASFIVNANHSAMSTAIELWVVDCVADCIRPAYDRRPGHTTAESSRAQNAREAIAVGPNQEQFQHQDEDCHRKKTLGIHQDVKRPNVKNHRGENR